MGALGAVGLAGCPGLGGDEGENALHELTATATFSVRGEERTVSESVRFVAGSTFGFNAGGEALALPAPVEVDGLDHPAPPLGNVTRTFSGNGGVATSHDDIEDTDADDLYRTVHWGGNLGYEVELEPGTYHVTLHFAEMHYGSGGAGGGTGTRVFDVLLDGETVIEDLDVYDEVGHDAALTKSVEVEVTDGTLTIAGDASSDYPLFSGFSIRKQ